MSEHTKIRLETLDGTVVAYFAPNFEINPVDQNNLIVNERAGENAAIAVDNSRWISEIDVQGAFEHSEELPAPHRQDLENLFGKSPVTAQDQINRIRAFSVYAAPQKFKFYHEENEYTATTQAGIDVSNGVYPNVSLSEIRPTQQAGLSRREYLVKLVVALD